MSQQLCIHDMDPAGCSFCSPREGGGTAPPAPGWQGLAENAYGLNSGLGRWFTSRYDGSCASCGDEYEAGDLLRYSGQDSGYISTCCSQEE